MNLNIKHVEKELAGLLQTLIACMRDIAPLFLDMYIVDSIEDNLVLFKILTNYFGPLGKIDNPYVFRNLTSIRTMRNQIIHFRVKSAQDLVRMREAIYAMAEVVPYLGKYGEMMEWKQDIKVRIIAIAEEWRYILATDCGYCFPDIPNVIKIDIPKSLPDVTNVAEPQKLDVTSETREDNIVVQKLASPEVTGTGSVLEGQIFSFKADYREEIKKKKLIILDGQYEGKEGKFLRWNGSNCYIEIDNVGTRALPKHRLIRLFLE